MKSHLRRLLPGDNTRLLAVASFIGLMSGLLNIVFRTTVHLVEEFFFKGGKEFLQIGKGDAHIFLGLRK